MADQSEIRKKQEAVPPGAEQARAVIDSMFKLSKLQKLYNPNNEVIKKSREAFSRKVEAFFAESDELGLRVTPTEIIFSGKPIYENADRHQSFAFKMFKDSIRRVTIKKGVSQEELDRFLAIVGTEFRSGDAAYEDLSTLLWKADFRSITYKCAKGFRELGIVESVDEEQADEKKVSLSERIFAKASRLTGVVLDERSSSLQFAGEDEIGYVHSLVSAKDQTEAMGPGAGAAGQMTEDKLQQRASQVRVGSGDAQAVGALHGEGDVPAEQGDEMPDDQVGISMASIEKFLRIVDATDAVVAEDDLDASFEQYKNYVEEETSDDNYRYLIFDLGRSLISVADKLLEHELRDMLASLAQMLHTVVEKGDIPLYFAVIDRLYLLLDPKKKLKPEVTKAVGKLLSEEIEEDNLRRLVLNVSIDDPAHAAKLRTFLHAFDRSPPDEVLAIIEKLEDEELIIRAESVLMNLAEDDAGFFHDKIYDRNVPIVKTSLKCLARMGNKEAMQHVSRAVRHPNPEIRMFALRLLKMRKGPEFRTSLFEMVSDRDEEVRMEAIREVSFSKDPFFKKKFLEKVESNKFGSLPLKEKIAVCKSLAAMAGKEVEPVFIKWLGKRTFLAKADVMDMKIAAAEALGVIGGDTSRKALIKASDTSNRQLKEACEKALRSMK
ncbi:MAG: HEAT repeat domain-containing protein [Pseudomonadota bacterium]